MRVLQQYDETSLDHDISTYQMIALSQLLEGTFANLATNYVEAFIELCNIATSIAQNDTFADCQDSVQAHCIPQ